LDELGVEVRVSERVVEVTALHVRTASGHDLPAALVVWAAGVRAPRWLDGFAGLATNAAGQIVVDTTLQSVSDPAIFALGDCAACPWPGHDRLLPPLAQAAHQQATHLARNLRQRIDGRPLAAFRYRNYGSLVSLGDWSAVGNLMGGLIGGAVFVEGLIARIMYVSNYNLHLAALHGWARTLLHLIGRFLRDRTQPRVKLH
jgi:NADH dehydrogenase